MGSTTGVAASGALLALDPTGTFFRFTKILQIVNKLYFININYGKRLEAFLAKLAAKYRNSKYYDNEHAYNTRGSLTKNRVTLDFVAAMSDKVILYLLSWIF